MRSIRTWMRALALGLIAALLLPSAASALQDSELDQLRERFRKRYPQLVELKRDGKVGETWQGYVEVVKPEYADDKVSDQVTVAQFLEAENSDRKRLYEIIAEIQGTTPQKVAERNALRNFSKAEKGEYLKGKDGKWVRKGEQEE